MKKINEIIDKNKNVSIVIIIVGLILILSLFFKSRNKEVNIEEIDDLFLHTEIEDENEAEKNKLEEGESLNPSEIVIDIKGAVKYPGVYFMDDGNRVINAIEQAGGVLDEAETTTINFAQLLTDQMVIYIPKVGEEIPLMHTLDGENIEEENLPSETVNINTAEKIELMTLNGIGEVKAENIISYREENGSFSSIEDLKNVSGIGEKTFENLQDEISVSN